MKLNYFEIYQTNSTETSPASEPNCEKDKVHPGRDQESPVGEQRYKRNLS
jgi:hypothetical protein